MHAEWWLIGLLLLLTMVSLWRQFRTRSAILWLSATILLLTASAFGWHRHLQKTESTRKDFHVRLPHPARAEYVSSAACRACHPDQYTSWHRSFHRTMTQVANPDTVRGNFNNLSLPYDGDDHRLERRGKEFWVETVDPDWKLVFALKKEAFAKGQAKFPPVEPEHKPKVWKQIDMLTGSHHMQACWMAGEFGNQQFIFPFIYLFEDQRWVPREEAFLKPPDAERMVQVWNGHCIRCHATAGRGLQDPKTSVFQTEVAELGIACEACHGPAYDHAQKNRDPIRRYGLHKRSSGDPTIINPARLDSKRSSEVCGSCHGVRFIRDQDDWMAHGYRFRPGRRLDDDSPVTIRLAKVPQESRLPEVARKNPEVFHGSFWRDGMIRVSGREYNGLLESPCFERGDLSCLSCHSMHKSDPDDQLAAGMDGNQACLQCHDKFRNSVSSHTHHGTQSSGSSCYNCHMPHTTYGLLKAIRSHQISSPSVTSTLASGRPNACNLCHLDKSLGWTATHLRNWYRIPKPKLGEEEENISAAVSWVLRGDAGERALLAWHMGWKPALEISGRDWMPFYLAHLLDDPYAAVRYVAKRSLKRFAGFEKLDYDYLGTPEQRRAIRQQIAPLTKVSFARTNAAVLATSDGAWQSNKISALISRRDDRPIELLE
jgi:predicted CXXCH cytochrome family protein